MLQSTAALLSETWSFLLVRWKGVGIGLLVFTMLLAANQAFFARAIDARVENVLQRTGLTGEQFEGQLGTLLREPPATKDVEDVLQALIDENTGGTASGRSPLAPTPANAGLYFVLNSMPLVFGLVVVALAVLLVSWVYFLLLAVHEARGAYDAALKLPSALLSMSLLAPWVLIRSFAWLPIFAVVIVGFSLPAAFFFPAFFAGMIAAALLLSRYVAAPFLLLGGQHRVIGAASHSAAKTKKVWLAIAGSWVTLCLFLLLGMWVASGITDVLNAVAPRVGLLVWLFALETAVAFAAVFQVRLSRAVMMGRH